MNKLRSVLLKTQLIPNAEHGTTVNGTGVDVSEFQDFVKLILDVDSKSGAGRTLDIEIEDGLTLGGAYASLSPAVTFTQVTTAALQEAINLNVDSVRPFIRAALTIAGTSPLFHVSLTMLGRTGQE